MSRHDGIKKELPSKHTRLVLYGVTPSDLMTWVVGCVILFRFGS